jgi:PAS domain S-box-containing protein
MLTELRKPETDVVRQVRNAVIAIDLEQRIVLWNSFAETLYQWKAEEALGRNIIELIVPDEGRRAAEAITESLKETGHWDDEFVVRAKDGRTFPVYVDVSAVRGTNGELIGFVGASTDITHLKRLNLALQDSDERFRSFMNHLPGYAWIKNADGSYVYMNKRLEEVLPKLQDDWVGRTDTDFWPPEIAAQFQNNDQRVLRSGQDLQAVETWIREGQVRYALVSKFPIFDAQGNAIMVGGASIDITEHKRAEQALRENQSHLQAILDYCPAMIFLKDLDGRYLQVNRELERTFNLTSEQVVGRTDAEVFPPELATAFRDSDRRVLEAGHSLESEEPAVYADGPHTYIVHKFPLRDAEGKVYAVGGISTDITARKRDEDKLRRQKELLQTIFDHIPLMISSFDKNGRMKPVNRECERTLGWCSEVSSDRRTDIFAELYPDPQKRQRGLDFIAAANGEWADFKTRAKDGRVVDTSWTVVRLSDGTRLGIGQDITERKRAEKALRASEERYRDLVENAHDIIYSHDLKGNYTSVNKAVEQITGYSREEALNINLAQIIAPEYLEQARSMIQRKLAGDKETVYDLEIVAKDGHRIAFEVNTRLIYQDGVPVGIHGIARDVTERKRAQEELRESEERFRDLVENSSELICTHDLDGWILSANRAAVDVLGYDQKEWVGKRNLRDILAPEVDRAAFDDYLARIRKDGTAEGVMLVQTRSGERRIWEYHNTLRTKGVVTPIVRGMARDITERKRAEEALRVTSEQLRALSASVQSAREEEGARIARELHDELGSALTSLKWDLEGIDKLCSQSVNQMDFLPARKKIEAMMGLIDATINTVTRISSELRPSILDDLGLAAAIEWQARQFEGRAGITCECDSFVEDIELSREKATAIFRIFQEALTNILRHAQATRVNITMEEERGEFVLQVRDNGRGIAENEKTGARTLGLIGMRERVHLVGGRIEVTGVAGKGTVLTVRVPIHSQATE